MPVFLKVYTLSVLLKKVFVLGLHLLILLKIDRAVLHSSFITLGFFKFFVWAKKKKKKGTRCPKKSTNQIAPPPPRHKLLEVMMTLKVNICLEKEQTKPEGKQIKSSWSLCRARANTPSGAAVVHLPLQVVYLSWAAWEHRYQKKIILCKGIGETATLMTYASRSKVNK